MIKRTIFIENQAFMRTENEQLIVSTEGAGERSIPIEDIGFLIIDNDRVSLSKSLLAKLLDNNTAVIITNDKHLPAGLMMPLDANTLQNERFKAQINIKEPLKKQLWKKTVQAKIKNQALIVERSGAGPGPLKALIPKVRSGDPDNIEALAAKRYWNLLFRDIKFKRGRYEDPPNNLLNYGYAVLRAIIARSLIGAGLLPVIGIHHSNRYNSYPLADDIMEPFRPFVDEIVRKLVDGMDYRELTKEIKQDILKLPHIALKMNKEKTPLMLAASNTAVSLYRCYENNVGFIQYPEPWN